MINYTDVMRNFGGKSKKTDNRTTGGRFEQELAEILSENGFWVHVLQQNKAGQPADIIAVRGAYHTLIDCKVISDDKGFSFERVEENQRYAMKRFQNRAREFCYFALKLPNGDVRMVSLERIETMKEFGNKRLTDSEIRNYAWSLEEWIKRTEPYDNDNK